MQNKVSKGGGIMARYIDAEKLKERLHIGDELMEKFNVNPAVAQLISIEKDIVTEMEKHIDETPTEEVTPIIRGKWEDTAAEIDKKYHRHSLICKNCLISATYFVNGTEDWWCNELPKYCPNCGAKMEESGETQ